MVKTKYPVVEEGNHLTVVTHENGRKELVWDHDALLRDVIAATTNINIVKVTEEKVKRSRKKKGE